MDAITKKKRHKKQDVDNKTSSSGGGQSGKNGSKVASKAKIDEDKLAIAGGKTKMDFATGRTLFPVDMGNGKIEYHPAAGDASDAEKARGAFVSPSSFEKSPVNEWKPDGKTVTDFNTGRSLFATTNEKGKTEYLPKKSEASAKELAMGLYVKDEKVKSKEVERLPIKKLKEGGKTVTDFNTGRTLFATENAKGKAEYLPKKSEASAKEVAMGLYVEDKHVKGKGENKDPADIKPGGKTVTDFNTGRTLFAAVNAKGKTEYLPAKSEASAKEIAMGSYVKDKEVNKSPINDLKPGGKVVRDLNTGRSLIATLSETGKTEYLAKKSEATVKELALGLYVDDIDVAAPAKSNDVLKPTPEFDAENKRNLYAVQTEDGSQDYVPIKSQASPEELAEGSYVDDEVIASLEATELDRETQQEEGEQDAENVAEIDEVTQTPLGVVEPEFAKEIVIQDLPVDGAVQEENMKRD